MSTELTYSGQRRRWEGSNALDTQRIWMDDATFRRYVWAYLEVQGIAAPTQEDLQKAQAHCRQWEYWKQCTDPNVHWITVAIGNKVRAQ